MSKLKDQETSHDELLDQLRAYETMSETSKQLLRQDPIGYATTRKRQLTAALMEGDNEQVEIIIADIAGMVGEKNAEMWKLKIMEKVVADSLEEQNRK